MELLEDYGHIFGKIAPWHVAFCKAQIYTEIIYDVTLEAQISQSHCRRMLAFITAGENQPSFSNVLAILETSTHLVNVLYGGPSCHYF